MGRWQIIQDRNPKIISDTGHNAEGLLYVTAQLQKEECHKLHIVLGVVSDKELSTILPLFPKDAIYYFTKPEGPRGLDESILKEKAFDFELFGEKYKRTAKYENNERCVYLIDIFTHALLFIFGQMRIYKANDVFIESTLFIATLLVQGLGQMRMEKKKKNERCGY